MSAIPDRFEQVAVQCKANVYFDGKVVSHSVFAADGTKRTLGLIFPGTFEFATDAPERMDIIAGSCRVRVKGEKGWKHFGAGTGFSVPGRSSFEIAVDEGLAEYVCAFEREA